MVAKSIRDSKGKRVTQAKLETLCKRILVLVGREGFITQVYVQDNGNVKIGLRRMSFRIDVAKLGHNARTDRYCRSPKGYKRTDVPTWEQRVYFNNLVNSVFDSMKLSASIVSGNYTIRTTSEGGRKHWPEGGDRNSNGYSGDASAYILPEAYARELLDSDRLEEEHRAKRKAAAQ